MKYDIYMTEQTLQALQCLKQQHTNVKKSTFYTTMLKLAAELENVKLATHDNIVKFQLQAGQTNFKKVCKQTAKENGMLQRNVEACFMSAIINIYLENWRV